MDVDVAARGNDSHAEDDQLNFGTPSSSLLEQHEQHESQTDSQTQGDYQLKADDKSQFIMGSSSLLQKETVKKILIR